MMRSSQLMTLSIVFILLQGCCTFKPDWAVSPSRIKLGETTLAQGVKKLKAMCNEESNKICNDTIEIIGHGAGSYRYYGMDINADGIVEGNNRGLIFQSSVEAKPVNKLMDQIFSIGNVGVDSIEIDVQVPNNNHPLCVNNNDCTFIMHNEPRDWDSLTAETQPVAYQYARTNTTKSVLQHFIGQKYHQNGKHLYLELKATANCMAPDQMQTDCTAPVNRVMSEVSSLIIENHTEGLPRNWITIVSFSATALQTAYKKLGDKAEYALIAGFNEPLYCGIKKKLAQCKGPVPQFTDTFKSFLKTEAWIDRVWYSPKGISDPESTFKNIIATRPDLRFSTSTYDIGESTLEESLEWKNKIVHPVIVSMMIDIDEPPADKE